MSDKIYFFNSSSNEITENTSDENIASPEVLFQPSEVRILSPEDIAHGALARLFDDFSDFPSGTMSNDPATTHKRALFNEDMDMPSGPVYPRSPIPRSPRITKPTMHFPSSSGQGNSNIRQKSPASRHLSPHRTVSKNKITFDWEDTNFIRKTQSTALPALKNGPWPRGTTVSTPDLKVEDQSFGTEAPDGGSCDRPRYPPTTCRRNLRIIFVILNCLILVAALLYFVAGVLLTVHRESALIIIEYRIYALCVMLFYIVAIVLIVMSLTRLCSIHRGSIKRNISCSLLMAAFTISLAILQSNVQTNVQTHLKERMMSSITAEPQVSAKSLWNYLQKTFECCGANGRFDWCHKNNNGGDETNTTDALGLYACRLPASCCIDNIDEIMSLEEALTYSRGNAIPCGVLPTIWNTHRVGCIARVRREIYYAGKLFRIISFGTGILLLLSSATATVFLVYL